MKLEVGEYERGVLETLLETERFLLTQSPDKVVYPVEHKNYKQALSGLLAQLYTETRRVDRGQP